MRIIFPNNEITEGGVAVLIPTQKFLSQLPDEWTEEQKLIHMADKDLPTGTKYEIVADDVPPSDRSFRNAWEYEAGAEEKTSADLSQEYQLQYNYIKEDD